MKKQVLSLFLTLPTVLLSTPGLADTTVTTPVKFENQKGVQSSTLESVSAPGLRVPGKVNTINTLGATFLGDDQNPGPNGVKPKPGKPPRPPRRDSDEFIQKPIGDAIRLQQGF
ncbi:hypothetical protein WA1_22270 [Scytonema hofmannii PCC 7110]|uniref:Uncharacterized protein n=1 Tax=Scytonema hofmannii PCC 7110 TaxID=128403 RepID=A0A139X9Q6_9CYAN|nr:hypothetical protein [Scytonema hofmannii]KYC41421.1 hypothetical protein WA1_22270 [Scytonema hofmannii PCC 7110]